MHPHVAPSSATNVTRRSLQQHLLRDLGSASLRVTMQHGMRSAILPIARRYPAGRMFVTKRLQGKFATDTAYGKVKSLRGYIGSQIYSHKCGFKACYPLHKVDGNGVGDSLTQFISDYGYQSGLHMMERRCKLDLRLVSWKQYAVMRLSIMYQVQEDPMKIRQNRPFTGLKRDGTD